MADNKMESDGSAADRRPKAFATGVDRRPRRDRSKGSLREIGGPGKRLVVFVYQFVARQNGIKANDAFLLNDAPVSPTSLVELLGSNKKYFKKVGYLP